VGEAIDLMQRYSISQLPVVRTIPAESLSDVVGSLQERGLLDRVFKNPDALNEGVAQAMQPPLHVIDASESIDRVFADLTAGSPAVVVARGGRPAGMLTRSDLLEYLAHRRNGV
jgi:cystathionine beta-synthase